MAVAKSRKILEAGRRARVLVVDDSGVMRRLVALSLANDPCLEVVGTAQNGREALERLSRLEPDVVTMDIEMPEMDGLEALRHIRQLSPHTRVVMLSTLTERGASATLEALALGADDYVTKAVAGKSVGDSTAQLRAELTPKIKQFFSFTGAASPANGPANGEALTGRSFAAHKLAPPPAMAKTQTFLYPAEQTPRIVCIGISTGGPTALAAIVPQIPKDFRLPILIVQHMPPLFTKLLCERLQEHCALQVREGAHGEPVLPGSILIAPGDYHMRVQLVSGERQPRIVLGQGPPENSCRPAVDVLFESIANLYGGATVAAVLTGMGHDGLRGAKLLKKAGATIIAQDEDTSAVWGMPRAIAEANIADAVLPLHQIVPQIIRRCQTPSNRQEVKLQETH